MKKIYFFLFAVSSLLSFTQLKANEVTVKGYIKFLSGAVAAGKEVYVSIETVQGTPCTSSQAVKTLSDGSYSTRISCSDADIRKVRISVKNCENQVIFQVKEVTSMRIIEANFSICGPPPTCAARFNFEPAATIATIPGFPFKFNSKGTETSIGDEIKERIWKFGDGEEKSGNVVDPGHVYKKPGVYNVCLTIRTAKGCSSTKCETIEIKQPCKASFTFETTSSGIRFNASTSVPADNISTRTWNFGDGSAAVSGSVNPLHLFAQPGTYNVCLTIRTSNGCESRECKTVVIPATAAPTSCTARYTFEQLAPKKFRFNGSTSVVGSGDNISSRSWDFGDGSTVVSNEISPAHEFSKPGGYQVCLRIKTARGCESKICLPVKVEETNQQTGAMVSIASIFPTPARSELKTILFSRNNNVLATIAIVNVYGEKKWSKQVMLLQGNNPFTVPTAALLPGPYFLRVITQYGTISKSFYKL